MKVVKGLDGKTTLKISKDEWVSLGKLNRWFDSDEETNKYKDNKCIGIVFLSGSEEPSNDINFWDLV